MRQVIIILLFVTALPGSSRAQSSVDPQPTGQQQTTVQSVPDLEQRLRALEEQVKSLQAELAALRGAPSQTPPVLLPAQQPPPVSVPTPSAPVGGEQPPSNLPVYGSQSTKVFNPDIGIIGNFLSASGQSRGGSPTLAPTPFATLQESEASLQAIVDPYARADFFLAIGEEGIEVEEGFVTFPSLPGGLLVKVGKMRANFGRLNAFHNHTLPWTDRPIVMYNLLGGATEDPDTGIKDAGVSVSRLIPAGGLFLEATGEVYRGDSGTLFQSHRREDFSAIGRLRGYGDLTESANIEIGGSYARGHNELGSEFVTQLFGADATFRWRPLRRGIYRSFAARTEVIWSRREQLEGTGAAIGTFASADYKFARRWIVGARYDWSERAQQPDITDRGWSGVLTFWPSEFSQVRGQYRRTLYGDRDDAANELLFQVLFTIGAHGAHAF